MVGYEPIKMNVKFGWAGHNVLSDAAWRWPAMKTLGVGLGAKDDKPYPESLYADRIRRQNNADWAFVLYVVDSLQDKDGMFRNNVIAYTADLFGPYSMLTYDNDGYGFAHFDAVLAHEMGHVFGALDEYRPPTAGYPSTGDLTSGYLGVRNGNADQGGSTHYDCIMRGSRQTIDSFRFGSFALDDRPDRAARQRRRLATGRGRHESGVLDHAGVHERDDRRRDLAGRGRRAAAPPRPHQRRRVLPPRSEHQGAARHAVPRGRWRLAARWRRRTARSMSPPRAGR